MSGSQAIEVHAKDEYQHIIDDIDYMIVSVEQLKESLVSAVNNRDSYPESDITEFRKGYINQFHKIREYKRTLGELNQDKGLSILRSEIRDYLFVLDDLEMQATKTIGLASELSRGAQMESCIP